MADDAMSDSIMYQQPLQVPMYPQDGAVTNGQAPSPSPKLRRNGTQQSCEPCRISKLRCDHGSPCARCIRQHRNCIYHPNPMTRRLSGASPSITEPKMAGPARKISHSGASGKPANPRKKSASAIHPSPLQLGMPFSYDKLDPKLEIGYMGSTAAAAMLTEHEEHTDTVHAFSEGAPQINGIVHASGDNVNAHRAYYSSILAHLPSKRNSTKVMDAFSRPRLGAYIRNLVIIQTAFHREFWKVFGEDLQLPRKPEALDRVAETLCRNTSKPLPIPRSNQAWFDSILGHRSRWDMVGLLFIRCSFEAREAYVSDTLIKDFIVPGSEPRKVAVSMFACAEACLNICESLDKESNMLVVFLRERCFALQSVLEGDTSFDLWRKGGALINAATALGLHRELEIKGSCSLLYIENRKQIFWLLYGLQLNVAIFCGRPNPLSWTYISLSPPVDAEEDLLLSDNLAEVEATLDENGWNKTERIVQNTMRRIYSLANVVRDAILELSLGAVSDNMPQRIENQRRKIEKIFSGMPPGFGFRGRSARGKMDFDVLYKAEAQLLRLQLLFLLDRIESPSNLEREHLNAARESVDIINSLWLDRDPIVESLGRDSIHWMISSFGVPAASAIAIDLWKQTKAANMAPDLSHRPEAIQQLSLFIAALGWLKEEDGNYILCKHARALIQRILDFSLDPSKVPVAKDHAMETNQFEPRESMISFNMLGSDPELEDWLHSTDWLNMTFNMDSDPYALQQPI